MIEAVIENLQQISTGFQSLAGNFHNLELLIQGQGEIIFNEETGNYEPVETQEIIYKARVKKKRLNQDNNIVGTDYDRIELEGCLVEPLEFTLQIGRKIKARLLNDGAWLEGFFFFAVDIESELIEAVDYRKILGQKIKGYFQVKDNFNI